MSKKTFLFGNRPAVREGGRFCYVITLPEYSMMLITSHKCTVVATPTMVLNMARSKKKMVCQAVAPMGE